MQVRFASTVERSQKYGFSKLSYFGLCFSLLKHLSKWITNIQFYNPPKKPFNCLKRVESIYHKWCQKHYINETKWDLLKLYFKKKKKKKTDKTDPP